MRFLELPYLIESCMALSNCGGLVISVRSHGALGSRGMVGREQFN